MELQPMNGAHVLRQDDAGNAPIAKPTSCFCALPIPGVFHQELGPLPVTTAYTWAIVRPAS